VNSKVSLVALGEESKWGSPLHFSSLRSQAQVTKAYYSAAAIFKHAKEDRIKAAKSIMNIEQVGRVY